MKNEKFMYETVCQGEYKVYFKGECVATTFDSQVNGDYSILISDSSRYHSYKIVGDDVFLHCCLEGKHGMKDKHGYFYFKDGEWKEDKSKSVKRFFD